MAKGFIPIEEMFSQLRKVQSFKSERISTWVDKVGFLHIFLVWTFIVASFGGMYYFFSGKTSHLLYSSSKIPVESLLDHIYFSFVTATTTGFGDIIPQGFFKIIAIVEVTFGLLLLAFVTSKLVSLKQDFILEEIYEISFQEKINGLRSSLLLFREHLNRSIENVESGAFHSRELHEIYSYLSSFEDTLNEISSTIEKSMKSSFTKNIRKLDLELIFNGITQSFHKLQELVKILNVKRVEWKSELTIDLIKRCLLINMLLFKQVQETKSLSKVSLLELQKKNEKETQLLKELVKLNVEEKS